MFFFEEIEIYIEDNFWTFCYVKITRWALDLEAADCKMQACYSNNYPSGAGSV
jgi:hypothetical protein